MILTTRRLTLAAAALLAPTLAFAAAPRPKTAGALPPNVIVIFTDDQGYNDVGCYGSPLIKTPRLDRMAAEGVRFTDFYVASPICSASRASLLTGRRPARHGIVGALFPDQPGLDPSEVTIPEVLATAGYASALFGKWHLGDLPPHLPTAQGFEEYFGIPFSNDMYIGARQILAADCVFREGFDLAKTRAEQAWIGSHGGDYRPIFAVRPERTVPLVEGVEVVEFPADQATLTRRYFDRAIAFLEARRDRPVFLFLNPAMPHVPLYASEEFRGRSARGLYGDTIEEIDANVGRLLDHLAASGREADTLVVFASDNGPWLQKGDEGGSAAPLRDGKMTNYEGGVRVPAIFRWPGRIPAGRVSGEAASTLDLLPTIARYAGARLDPSVALDGIDLGPHLERGEPLGREAVFHHKGLGIGGVRVGAWKLLVDGPHFRNRAAGEVELFNLAEDPGETRNLAAAHPERVAELRARIEALAATLPPAAGAR